MRERDRRRQATALAQAFKKDLLIMLDKQQKVLRINDEIHEARASFAVTITEYCALHTIDDFPCTFDYHDAYTGNTRSITMNEGQYADLRELGIRTYGRELTPSEVVQVFNTIRMPEEFRLQEFTHQITYEHSERVHTLVIEKERFKKLAPLIPLALPTEDLLPIKQAEPIIDVIRIKLGGKGRSLKQFMACKASLGAREKLDAAETVAPLSLAASSEILDAHFKALPVPAEPQSLH
jgi:hypothetical protein